MSECECGREFERRNKEGAEGVGDRRRGSDSASVRILGASARERGKRDSPRFRGGGWVGVQHTMQKNNTVLVCCCVV